MTDPFNHDMSRPVPCHTGHPTTPHVSKPVDQDTGRGWLVSLDTASPVSLYLTQNATQHAVAV